MTRASFTATLLLALVPILAGCDDDEDTGDPTGPGDETYSVTFTGDDTFQGAHGGQSIMVAIVEAGTGTVVAEDDGTVSGDADPTFEFTFTDVLEEGTSYNLDYWIDSNFGGGEEGTCDPPENDHQWRISLGEADSDETVDETHRPGETESVCTTFG